MKKHEVNDIESIWNSVDGIKPAEAPAYLYSKVMNRLTAEPTGTKAVFRVKPLFVLGALICGMLLNIWMLNQQSGSGVQKADSASIADFSNEYGLQDSYPN